MTTDQVREARSACERQFSFLVTDFGYRKVRGRFKWNGFELRYRGSTVGVVVQWFPRDPLTVLLARLVNGDFAAGTGAGDAQVNYFDLGDIESIASASTRLDDRRLYGIPDDETARIMAQNLREYASGLLRGDLSLIPQLEQRVAERRRRYEAEMRSRAQGRS